VDRQQRETVVANEAAILPKNEIERLTEHVRRLFRFWRKSEFDRTGGSAG
jgi:hypothetical protein